jgi:hypothetical protein
MKNNIAKLSCVEKEQLFAHEAMSWSESTIYDVSALQRRLLRAKNYPWIFAISVRDCRRFTVDA